MNNDWIIIAVIVPCAFIGLTFSGMAEGRPLNLLRNASFEFEGAMAHAPGAFHWMLNDPDHLGDSWGSASRESWRAKEGHYAGTIRGRWAGKGAAGGWWQDSPATSGRMYHYTGWFFADPEWSARDQFVKLEFRDARNATILSEVTASLHAIENTWTQISLSARAPAGTAYIRLVVHASDVSNGGALQFDQFSLVAID